MAVSQLLKKDRDFDVIGYKNMRKVLRELKQRGTSNLRRDVVRKALPPGKRISKTGRIYWETRKNRSDKAGSNL